MFQTFPFLEQARRSFVSARAWVQEVLKPVDGTASTALESKVEERLASEIDTDQARVVQGDGLVSSSKKDELLVSPKLPAAHKTPAKDATESDEGASSQDEEPSWVNPSPWPSPPPTPEEADVSAHRKCEELTRRDTARSTASTRSNASVRSRTSSITNSSLWRLSPFTSTVPLPPQPTPTPIRRVRSRPHLRVDVTSHPPSKEYRLPKPSPAIHEPAPQPSIRRSHSSHPDITSLCNQWANQGPANQTLTYKPDTLPHRRKHSGSVSSIISMTTRSKAL